jgi:DNA polymerase-3 subunit epsilon
MFFHSPPWDEVVYWSLDLETGGLDEHRDAIVSVGMVPVRAGTILLGEAFHSLVRPAGGMALGAPSIAAHQLTPGELADAPGLAEVIESLDQRLREGVLLVHQAGVDVAFLKRAYRALGRRWPKPQLVDTVQLLLALAHRQRFASKTPEQLPTLNLAEARRELGLPEYTAHDPVLDALACAELFLLLRYKLSARRLRDLT